MNKVTFRQASAADAADIHRLITDNLEVGHLLPRTFDDVVAHAPRFVVADHERIGTRQDGPEAGVRGNRRGLTFDPVLLSGE